MSHGTSKLLVQPTDTREIQSIIDELQLTAQQCIKLRNEPYADLGTSMQVACNDNQKSGVKTDDVHVCFAAS